MACLVVLTLLSFDEKGGFLFCFDVFFKTCTLDFLLEQFVSLVACSF